MKTSAEKMHLSYPNDSLDTYCESSKGSRKTTRKNKAYGVRVGRHTQDQRLDVAFNAASSDDSVRD